MYAQGFELSGDFLAKVVDDSVVGECAQHPLSGVIDHAFLETHGGSPLCVHGDEQGCLAEGLVFVDQGDLSGRSALKKTEASYFVIFYVAGYLFFIGLSLVGVGPDHEHLTYSFLGA